jgi:GTPase SAR1 family protein
MSQTGSSMTDIDSEAKDIKIAVIGAGGTGKTTLILNFLKGYIPPNEAPNLDLNQIVKDSNGTFQVDLELNGIRYSIEIQERHFDDARDDYLDEFDGVIYMYATNDPQSFIEMKEFYEWQKDVGKKLRPSVAIGTKLDLIPDKVYENSFMEDKDALLIGPAGLNFCKARTWTTEEMGWDYAEISCEDPVNVDEVFCLLVGNIEKANYEKKENQSTKVRAQNTIVSIYRKIGEKKVLAQILLTLVSLFGIIFLGAAFYSGAKTQRPKDDNWLYVILLFIALFSFISGIVGFYGVKHESKEYLKTIMVILIPLSIIEFVYVIVFFVKLNELRNEENNILTPNSANTIAVLNCLDLTIKVVTIFITIQVYKNFRGDVETGKEKISFVHTQYKALESEIEANVQNIAKSHKINPSGEFKKYNA